MPRHIIDTESSRPAYRRRLAVRWTIIIAVVVIVVFVVFEMWKGRQQVAPVGMLVIPGKAASTPNQGPVPRVSGANRSDYAA